MLPLRDGCLFHQLYSYTGKGIVEKIRFSSDGERVIEIVKGAEFISRPEYTIRNNPVNNKSRNLILREAAQSFVTKAVTAPSVVEVAIVGSVAGNDLYAGDLDLALVLDRFDDLGILAKYARQMSPVSHEWEVFVFDSNLACRGRICHRRECARQSADCLTPGCGEAPHLRIIGDFTFDEAMFFESPFDILHSSGKESLFVVHKNELGISTTRAYPVLKAMKLTCVQCGRRFVMDPGEQKWYARRGMEFPKRCLKCRQARMGFSV